MQDCKCRECHCGQKTITELLAQIEDPTLPYHEEWVSEGVSIRTFDSLHPDHLFKWHWDEEDRLIEPLHQTDWSFQFDDDLPFTIEGEVLIPAGIYHRLIKGTGTLSLQIKRA